MGLSCIYGACRIETLIEMILKMILVFDDIFTGCTWNCKKNEFFVIDVQELLDIKNIF